VDQHLHGRLLGLFFGRYFGRGGGLVMQ